MSKIRFKEVINVLNDTNLPAIIIEYLKLNDNSTDILTVYKNVQKLKKQYLKNKPARFKSNQIDLEDSISDIKQEKQNKENGLL